MKAIITTAQKTWHGTIYTRVIYYKVIRILCESKSEKTITIEFKTINGCETETYDIKDVQIEFEK